MTAHVHGLRVCPTTKPEERWSAPVGRVRQFWAGSHLRWAAFIFCLAFILRYAWTVAVNPDPLEGGPLHGGFLDFAFYYGSAQSLAAGEGYRDPWTLQYTVGFPPGCPLLLALPIKLFGHSLLVAKLFNVFVGAATAVLDYALATMIRDQRAGIVAGCLMALFPSQIFFSTMIMTEPFFAALSAGLVLFLTVWLPSIGRTQSWQALVLGLFLGFMTLVRAEAILLAPAVVALWRICGLSWRGLAPHIPVLLFGMALLITPWTARNYARFDQFILLRSNGQEIGRSIRVGLSPDYDDRYKYQWLLAEPKSTGEPATYYGTQPWEIFATAGNKLLDLFGHDDVFFWIQGNYEQPPLSPRAASQWSALANSYYFVVGFAALLSLPLWLSTRDRRLLATFWFITSWSLIQMISVPSVRYHFPVIAMICVLAASALLDIRDHVAQSRPIGSSLSVSTGAKRPGPDAR